MKKYKCYLLIIFLIGCTAYSFAQPFTLDEEIKPIKLDLSRNTKKDGTKFLEVNNLLSNDKIQYFYVKGYSIFEYIDVFIFAHNEDAKIDVQLVKDNWKSVIEEQSTTSSNNGIINYKIHSYGDFGLAVKTSESENIKYSIIINASKPIRNHLKSPFVKATKKDLEYTNDTATSSKGESSTIGNTWLYVLIGVLLLIVGLLFGKISGNKKNLSIILLLALLPVCNDSICQTIGIEKARESIVREELERVKQQQSSYTTRRKYIDSEISKMNKAIGTAQVASNAFSKYRNLGKCLIFTPPMGQPKIPSFCDGQDSDCALCYTNARENFNKTRYRFEELQTIYNCTKDFTKAMIAFGDNVSGYHGVSGLAWQAQRVKVMKSIVSLDKSYDKKRIELLESLNNALLELDACEQEHGIKDWYDRFGVLFYNFAEMRYHR